MRRTVSVSPRSPEAGPEPRSQSNNEAIWTAIVPDQANKTWNFPGTRRGLTRARWAILLAEVSHGRSPPAARRQCALAFVFGVWGQQPGFADRAISRFPSRSGRTGRVPRTGWILNNRSAGRAEPYCA